MAKQSSTLGSQRLLQRAVNVRPELLLTALRRASAINSEASIEWKSPLEGQGGREYRDIAALRQLGFADRLKSPLSEFWPARGPVWDALGVASDGTRLLVEAKAHIPEMASPGTASAGTSLALIRQSLEDARRQYAPRSKADWTGTFYQYANRLAFHHFLSRSDALPTRLVFLAFTNASEVDGPASEEEWHGATRLLHAVLGLPADLTAHRCSLAFGRAKRTLAADKRPPPGPVHPR
jgi:hypothetical protein